METAETLSLGGTGFQASQYHLLFARPATSSPALGTPFAKARNRRDFRNEEAWAFRTEYGGEVTWYEGRRVRKTPQRTHQLTAPPLRRTFSLNCKWKVL